MRGCDSLYREGEVSWSALTLSNEEGAIFRLFYQHLFSFRSSDPTFVPPVAAAAANQ